MAAEQVFLQHGKVKGIGGIASLTVTEFHHLAQPRNGQLQFHVPKVYCLRFLTDKILVLLELLCGELHPYGFIPYMTAQFTVPVQVAVNEDHIGIECFPANKIIEAYLLHELLQINPILFPPQIYGLCSLRASLQRYHRQSLVDFRINLLPRLNLNPAFFF